jgi:transcription antitermination factor NusG
MLSDLSSASRVWAVLAVKPRKEDFSLSFLRKEGFDAYCPKLKVSGRREPTQPLFPGYVFAFLSPKMELPAVRFFPGIRKPLIFGEQVACLEPGLIERWQAREGGRGYITPDPPPGLKVGQKVRFKEGVFIGLEGTVIENLPSRERVRVLLDYLETSISVEADRSLLS